MYLRGRLTIRVLNLERSMDFYGTRMGLALVATHGADAAEFDAAGTRLLLHRKAEHQPDRFPAGTIALSLQVADIATAVRELESRGVVFEGEVVEVGEQKLAFTSDPDGVPIYLLEAPIRS